ncbi:MAG: FAD-linked oxidase C-terminal domain-containing protein [Pseudomonadota bacterium]
MSSEAAAASSLSPVIELIRALVGDRLSTSLSIREQHGKDQTHNAGAAPDAVVFAESTEEVQAIVQMCAERGVPIIPYGTGTSLEGHITALNGGITLDLSGMNQVLEVNPEDLDCRVQAGVTRKQINSHLRDTGLFFPVDPGADASIGGMTATRASGTNAVRYGTMRENVLGLTVVTADGKIIKTGGRARKSSAGYDLTRLFVGSEGTLGVITEIGLRLYGVPEAISSAVCAFPTVDDAVNTVIQTIQMGVPVARIELLDALQMKACIAYSKLEDMKEAPTLFFEFHGSDVGVQEQATTVGEIAAEFGGDDFQWATRPEDRNRLWEARHNAFYAVMAAWPNTSAVVTDVCVPISRLAECIARTQEELKVTRLISPLVGHAGDGNFHLSIMVNMDDPDELKRAKALSETMVEQALACGGTCTGEHGVGMGKMHYLEAEHGEALHSMRAIKKALDPQNIMNPGKVVQI